jgi:hypothetical protein
MNTSEINLKGATRVLIHGESVTFERDRQGWVCTGWQQGLPVARRPFAEQDLRALLTRFPNHSIL